MPKKSAIWKDICDKSPAAWKEFVEWFAENHPARANHSERWVDTITIDDLNDFFEDKGVNTAIGIVLEGSFTALEKIRSPEVGQVDIDNVMPVSAQKKGMMPKNKKPKTRRRQLTPAQMAAKKKRAADRKRRRGRKSKEPKAPF